MKIASNFVFTELRRRRHRRRRPHHRRRRRRRRHRHRHQSRSFKLSPIFERELNQISQSGKILGQVSYSCRAQCCKIL